MKGLQPAGPLELEPVMQAVVAKWVTARVWVRRVGPYVAIEAVMPGGTLLALALYLWNNRKDRAS